MKEKINELRLLGYSYNQISKELKCSKGTIAYHLNPDVKLKKQCNQTAARKNKKDKYKSLLGGKCKICGYCKCNGALHFHHRDPDDKKFEITKAIWGFRDDNGPITEDDIIREVMKCDLLCSNCHAEEHFD